MNAGVLPTKNQIQNETGYQKPILKCAKCRKAALASKTAATSARSQTPFTKITKYDLKTVISYCYFLQVLAVFVVLSVSYANT